ncbi:hypothetical protein HEM31_021170 [Escherichia coli]|nr:hypothetical protein [Escherichia coli]
MSGDENKLKKYRFPETLTNQSRWFGLPLDELIPAAICIGWGIRDELVRRGVMKIQGNKIIW